MKCRRFKDKFAQPRNLLRKAKVHCRWFLRKCLALLAAQFCVCVCGWDDESLIRQRVNLSSCLRERMSYVGVAEEEGGEPTELPVEEDGTGGLSTFNT